jgi:LuxR family maltose regulon positive regulatory protein
LAEYLRADIVSRLDTDDATFLSRVSVLPTLDADSCNEVSGTTDSLARLRRLASANHLIVVEDEAAERFRMHPLLAEAMSEQLREGDADAWRTAHVVASRTEERRGDLDGAVHHAKLAGDDERLAELVWSQTGILLASGQWTVLQRWLAGLDEARLKRRCGLALSAAWLASHAGDMPRMRRLALAASERSIDEDPTFVLDVGLLAATIGTSGLGSIEAAARAFIDGKPRTDPWQTLSHFLLGVGLFFRDESDQSRAAFDEGLQLATAWDLPVMAAHCLAALADTALADGEEHKALSLIRQSRDLAVRHGIDTIATAAPIFTTSAMGYVLEGRFADARREATRALRLTALITPVAPWHAVQGRLTLALVNTMLGDPARARVLLAEAGDARGPSTVSPRLDRMYDEVRARLEDVSTSLVGSSALTTAEVRVLQYLPTHLSVPQIADELFVSRHTVKTQVLSAYRKLGVHSRTEAIDASRRAGLLPSE